MRGRFGISPVRGLLLAAALSLASVAEAGDLVFGAGYANFSDGRAEDAGLISIEYHSEPVTTFARADLSFAAGLVGHTNGDVWVGAGLSALWPLRRDWFVEASVMPGYFDAADTDNDLGSDFEIRSLLGVGRRMGRGTSLSLAISHTSNADLGHRNPGVNALELRWRRKF